MRILHTVELYEPSVGGAQEVVRQISTRLAARGHDVTVATSALDDRRTQQIEGVNINEFAITGNAARGMRGDLNAYREFVIHGAFDVVMGYGAQQWTVDALLPVLDRIPSALAVAPCGFSGLRDRRYAKYFAELPERLRKLDALIFHSNAYQDVEFARRAGLEGLTVIPNGADEREFSDLDALDARAIELRRRYRIDSDTPLLLTVGSHTGEKGHALAIRSLQLLGTPRAVLIIVGNNPLGIGCRHSCRVRAAVTSIVSHGRKRTLSVSLSRADVVAAYRAADLFVFGSAVECSPLVLFEAMAAGRPFISLDVGNSVEIARWSGGAGRILPTEPLTPGRVTGRPEDLARAVERLLRDPATRARMGAAGRAAWEANFTWATIAARYESLYADLVRDRITSHDGTVADPT